jgi:hypothetical protein
MDAIGIELHPNHMNREDGFCVKSCIPLERKKEVFLIGVLVKEFPTRPIGQCTVPFRCMEILIFRPRNFSFHGARAFL